MMDNGAKLERMANEIATYFRTYPHDEAVAGVHDHIKSFWAPIMRRDLAAHLEAHPEGADPLVVEAFQTIILAKSPANKEAAGPGDVGQIGASDAG